LRTIREFAPPPLKLDVENVLNRQ